MKTLRQSLAAPRRDAWVRLGGWPKGPRILRHQIKETAASLAPGDQVAVLDRNGEHWGWGLYHPESRIRVRMLRQGKEPANPDWLRERAQAAIRRRAENPEVDLQADAFRVLHAEGDDFSGLVVDRLGEILSAEIFTSSAAAVFQDILPTLHQELGTREHRLMFDTESARAEKEKAFSIHSPGCPPKCQLQEHGLRYEVTFAGSHKTGFFCDQRDNRRRFATLAEGRSVLDVCCYSGGFALNAARAGAREVLALDLDEKALAQAKRNGNLNQLRNLRWVHADAFSYLRTLTRNERQYEVVMLDPPKFIHSPKENEEGIARYHDLNKLALQVVAPGGWLVSCSCSGLLPLQEFRHTIRRAARSLGRTVRVEKVTGAPPDHPIRLDFPEGEYLKALWMRVD
ncbi:MAG: class I SAM-dependent rRNA methyltransferase [Planctomycetota bacterium]|nr:MAG: class I SAM-dependent rRNA methyltransferase [Planctomycetota bacterium]